jgi:hypothetical protein
MLSFFFGETEDDALSLRLHVDGDHLSFLSIVAGRVFLLQGSVQRRSCNVQQQQCISSDQTLVTTHHTQPAMQCTLLCSTSLTYADQTFLQVIFKGHIGFGSGLMTNSQKRTLVEVCQLLEFRTLSLEAFEVGISKNSESGLSFFFIFSFLFQLIKNSQK